MTILRIDQIASYHAHVYFNNAAERDMAALLRDRIAARFLVQLGNWHDVPVGPHQRPMYQVAFATATFATFLPWLMLNRLDLTILVHPNTGRARSDHLVHAIWLGDILPIIRPEQLPDSNDGAPEDPIIPNTAPNTPP